MRPPESSESAYAGVGVVPFGVALEIGKGQTVVRFLNAEAKRNDASELLFDMPQTLVIVAGHEGSGKSRVTRALEAVSPVVVIDKDPLTNAFSNGRAEHGDPVHAAMRPLVYETMYALAGEALDSGRSVVLDAPFNKFEDFFHNPAWVATLRRIADERGVAVKVVWCTARPEVKKARTMARGAPQDRRRSEAEHEKLSRRTDVPNIRAFPALEMDTELPDEVRAELLAEFLELRRAEVDNPPLTILAEGSTLATATFD